MDGRIGFIVFYAAFIGILITVTATMPLTIISGLSQSDLDSLLNNVTPPAEPNILEALIYQFQVGLSWITNLFILIGVSSSYQFVSLILTPLTIGLIASIYSLVRSG